MDRRGLGQAGICRWFFRASAILLLAYAVDVIAGKVAEKLAIELSFQLHDVGEFLVVMAGVVCFVVGMLMQAQESEEVRVE